MCLACFTIDSYIKLFFAGATHTDQSCVREEIRMILNTAYKCPKGNKFKKMMYSQYSTLDYTLWTLYRSYFKGINANIDLQMYSETSCLPYLQMFVVLSPFGVRKLCM
jgi:hypothetical protein